MTTDHVDASIDLRAHLHDFFATKTSCDVDGTMAYFAPGFHHLHRRHARVGLRQPRRAALGVRAVHAELGPTGAVVRDAGARQRRRARSCTWSTRPELFGGELRVLAAIDLDDGRIVRWVDYWDASAYDPALYAQFRTPEELFPRDLREVRDVAAAPELVAAATELQAAFAATGTPRLPRRSLHTDVVLVDMALRAHVIGAIEAAALPGPRARRRAVRPRRARCATSSAAAHGGGFEWTSASGGVAGLTAIELDADGLITSITSVYDSRQLAPTVKAALVAAATPVHDATHEGSDR